MADDAKKKLEEKDNSSNNANKKNGNKRSRRNGSGGNPAKPRAAYGTNDAANPGDGEVMTGGKGSTGEMEAEPAAELDARAAYKQDPAWAQTNPTEYANAFVPAYSNYDQVIRGAAFPWYLCAWQPRTVIGNRVINVEMDDSSAIEEPYQFFICEVGLSTGECWHPQEYGSDYQPFVYIGKLLYQAISARKRNALPVDSLSISAYLMAFQSIVALRSFIRLVLKLCSIVECSEKNAAKRPQRMLRAILNSQQDVEEATGMLGTSNTNNYWKNAVGAINAIDGTMNQCMSPPELPVYKRADYLFSHVISEYSDDEMSNFYIMRPSYVYRINWVGDENGTYLAPEFVSTVGGLHTLIDLYRSLVNSFTGGAFGADDPNHIQAGLKYVFANKIKFNEWQSVTYTTSDGKEEVSPVRSDWADVLASGIDCHTWLHNMKQLPHNFWPGDISYDNDFMGLRQRFICESQAHLIDAFKDQIPTAWDFEFGQPSADDLYEASTLTAMYRYRATNSNKSIKNMFYEVFKKDTEFTEQLEKTKTRIDELKSKYTYKLNGFGGNAQDKENNKQITQELNALRDYITAPVDFSMGTEFIRDISVVRVSPSFDKSSLPYKNVLTVSGNSTVADVQNTLRSISAFANFNHRPLQYLTYKDDTLGSDTRVIFGVNYDTYALCPVREDDVDRMHYTSIKSYFGISNKDTLSWITPTSAYSDLDKT